ncbi:hypothetical protein F4781DRAFT_385782 [Annulohypoxylon bovei var. microspora]|nr:hypothetical protein F4781DRAFT_385782 [Annulohypoxylon bovei var. microspora]
MSCSCRTTSLRVFIQSLTEVRVFDSAVATTRLIQPQYTRAAGLRSQFILVRPYSATAALGFPRRALPRRTLPRQTIRELPSQSSATHQAPEATRKNQSNDAKVDQPIVEALNASSSAFEEARNKGAILEFSPESIDSLVADLEESPPPDPLPLNLKMGPAVYEEPDAGLKPTKESKRLRALTAMKEKRRKMVAMLPRHLRKEYWAIQKQALREKFPEGWKPRKRLSPDALDGIRALHAQFPDHYTTDELSDKFEVSPEAIRRILKSNWRPNAEEEVDRQGRWFNRGKAIWGQMAAIGRKPPRKWRKEGVVREHFWNIPKGPRTQPPKQRKPRHFDGGYNRGFDKYSYKDSDRGFDSNSYKDSDKSFDSNSYKDSDRSFDRNSYKDSNGGFSRDSNGDSNAVPNKKSNGDSNAVFNEKFNKKFDGGFSRDSNRGSKAVSNKKSNKKSDGGFDRDNFDRQFDRRFDPDSKRGPDRRYTW